MTNSANRALWVVLGLLLTAFGVFGILANLGQIPNLDPESFLFGPNFLDFWRDLDEWGPIIVIALGLVLALLGGALLRAQLHQRGAAPLPDVTLREVNKAGVRSHKGSADGEKGHSSSTPPSSIDSAEIPGTTTVRNTALTHGFKGDLQRIPHVIGTQVALTGDAPTPTIWLQFDLDHEADLSVVRDHVNGAINRFNATSGLSPARVDVTARIGAGPPTARVR